MKCDGLCFVIVPFDWVKPWTSLRHLLPSNDVDVTVVVAVVVAILSAATVSEVVGPTSVVDGVDVVLADVVIFVVVVVVINVLLSIITDISGVDAVATVVVRATLSRYPRLLLEFHWSFSIHVSDWRIASWLMSSPLPPLDVNGERSMLFALLLCYTEHLVV